MLRRLMLFCAPISALAPTSALAQEPPCMPETATVTIEIPTGRCAATAPTRQPAMFPTRPALDPELFDRQPEYVETDIRPPWAFGLVLFAVSWVLTGASRA